MSQQTPPPGYYPPPYWPPNPPVKDDEIDLIELLRTIVANKKLIIAVTSLCTLIALIAAFVITPVYRAEVLLAPASLGKNNSNLSALASQFGGLASLAGISMPAGGDVDTSIAILKSREFITGFIKKHNLKPILFADNWDSATGTWKKRSPSLLERLGISSPHQAGEDKGALPGEPTDWDSYKRFKNDMLIVSQDKKSSLITVAVEWKNPEDAAQWANELVADINAEVRQQAIDDAQKSITYLKEQLKQTDVTDLRSVLFSLIEEHTKNITLAKVNEQYAFRVIDPAVAPQEKAKPRRGTLVIMGMLLGFIFSLVALFVKLQIARLRSTRDTTKP